MLTYQAHEKILLKQHPDFNEKWLQEIISNNPEILGLGRLVMRDKERPQAGAGRLDLLLQDQESLRRYEVEIQLGKTDESHLIRTIEYWDLERKRYPQYDHCAVIIAEEITGRFLNVIQLFNGHIPLVAIQLNAVRMGDKVMLVFNKVLDEVRLGLVDDDEDIQTATDRTYWETYAGKPSLHMVDECFALLREVDSTIELKYNKFYIGLARNGKVSNFVTFQPRKESVKFEPKIERSEEMDQLLAGTDLDVMDYDSRWGRYRIRLTKGQVRTHRDLLKQLAEQAMNN